MIAFRAIILVLIGLTAACVSSERYQAASQDLDNQDDVIRKLKAENDELRRERERISSEYDLIKAEAERLRGQAAAASEVESLRAQLAALRDRFSSLDGLDGAVKVTQTPEGTKLSVAGHVLFETASCDISARGRDILDEIAARLVEGGHSIRVEGHTDDVPIIKARDRYPKGNLQLSGARALEVAAYIIDQGVPRDRVSFAGFGAERPVADNSTDDGRQQNRRVEILVLSR